MRIARKLKVAAVLGVAATLALTACTQKSQSGGGSESGGASGGGDGTVKVAFVPKLQGIPYFEAMNTGGQAAARSWALQWIYQGPTTGRRGRTGRHRHAPTSSRRSTR